MDPIALAQAADANFVTHAGWAAARVPGMVVRDEPDLVLVDSGLGCDTFNFVLRARLDRHTAPGRIAGVLEHFRRAGRPFSWWVGPADRPADLGALLEARGLEPSETELAMAANLAGLPAEAPPAGLEIRRVRTAGELADFARVNAANWSPPDVDVLRFHERTAPVTLSPGAPLWFYVGYLEGVPVAAAELTIGGGVAGLYGISTLAGFRRRGFGTALTLRPLLDARAMGLGTAVLQASADGAPVYRRLGFETFGGIVEFKPAPGA